VFHQQDGPVSLVSSYPEINRIGKAEISLSCLLLRAGSNPFRVINQLRTKLRMNAAAVQVPIGSEDNLRGVVDLVRMKAIYNEGVKG
jgi:hypothetical protein